MKKIITIFTLGIVTSILFTLIVPSFTVHAEGEQEISINILPENVLFDVDNLKPGDWVPRTIKVENNGEIDFEYQMSLDNIGSEKLFNELMIEISDDNDELYNGKLSDYESIPSRNLVASSEEELDITVRFPEHLGNDYQGLDAKFNINFRAEGTEDMSSSDESSVEGMLGSDGNGSLLPETATNTFNFLLIGVIFLASGGALYAFKRWKTRSLDKQHVKFL